MAVSLSATQDSGRTPEQKHSFWARSREVARERILSAVSDCNAADVVIGSYIRRYHAKSILDQAHGDVRSAITGIEEAIASLKYKKGVALDELRLGLRCSKCNSSKSEIEAKGETFYHHLSRVEGEEIRVPASASELASKAAEFDRQIESLETDLATLQKAEGVRSNRSADLWNYFNDWTHAQGMEAEAFGLVWRREKAIPEREIYDLRQRQSKASGNLKSQLSKQVEAARQSLRQRYADRLKLATDSLTTAVEELDHLRSRASSLSEYVSWGGSTFAKMGTWTQYVAVGIDTNGKIGKGDGW